MNDCKQQEWIDEYLLGELSDEEHQRFEAQYDADEAFRVQVDLQAAIMLGVKNHYAAAPKIVNLRPASKRLWVRRLGIAATIALVIMAGIMLQNEESNTTIAGNNTEQKTNPQHCTTQIFHTNSGTLAMVGLNQLCSFPLSTL